jgi:hypothetical protein
MLLYIKYIGMKSLPMFKQYLQIKLWDIVENSRANTFFYIASNCC